MRWWRFFSGAAKGSTSPALSAQVAQADWHKIVIGIACIYLAYVVRSARWAQLLRHNKKVHPLSLFGTQAMGFTAIALIGRVADPVRPYLVSKKTGLPLSSQFAVYIVERLFDAGSMALIFSVAMLWIPEAEIVRATGHSKLCPRCSNIPLCWLRFLRDMAGWH